MTTRSLPELARAVGEKLSVLAGGGTMSAEDSDLVTRTYRELFAGLVFEDLAYWDEDAVPLLVFPAVVDLVCLHVAPAFGKKIVEVTDIEAAEVPIKRRIRKYTAKPATGDEIHQRDF